MNWLRRIVGLPAVETSKTKRMADYMQAHTSPTELKELESHLLNLRDGRKEAQKQVNWYIANGYLSLVDSQKRTVSEYDKEISETEAAIARLKGGQ